MIRSILAAIAISLVFPGAAPAADSHKWTTYKNVRFGTQALYPADLFRPLEPPANGAGLEFESPDGASLVIQGMFNTLDDHSPAAYAREYYTPDTYPNVTYQASGKDWFVLSGTRDGNIYYDKVIMSCRGDVVNALTIVYPASLQTRYDPLVGKIEKSLRPGRGEDTTPNCP